MSEAIQARPRVTAEWLCTRCGVTNRQFVLAGTPVIEDRCVACHAKHLIWPSDRPVRWNSEAK